MTSEVAASRPVHANGFDPLYERSGWWDEDCRNYASLRSVAAFRLRTLLDWLGGSVRGLRVVDLGCGGGLFSVPLAEAGARVIGLDLALAALREAAGRRAGALFAVASMEAAPIASASADLVLLADVLEHVPDPVPAVAEAARILRPGGRLFTHTINRTLWARLIAKSFAETFGLIPRGTHDPAWFVRPQELEQIARQQGLLTVRTQGERPDILRTLRHWTVVLRSSRSRAIGYAMLFARTDRGAC